MISPYIVMCGILILGLLQGLFSQGTSHFSVLAGIRTKNALLLSLFEKILRTPSTKSQEGECLNFWSEINIENELYLFCFDFQVMHPMWSTISSIWQLKMCQMSRRPFGICSMFGLCQSKWLSLLPLSIRKLDGLVVWGQSVEFSSLSRCNYWLEKLWSRTIKWSKSMVTSVYF